MVFVPRLEEGIWNEEVLPQLRARSSDFTHVIQDSANYAISREIFTAQLAVFSQALLYAYFSGHLPYAGKEITEEDLRDLKIDPARVNLPLINGWQSDADLEAQAAANSVSRDPGAYATGEVLFTVAEAGATVPDGVEVTTEPDAADNRLRYATTESVTADANATTVLAPVRAAERGTDSNIGSGRLESLPNPPSVVQSVTNPDPIIGGEPPESNAQLRERAMNAMSRQSGGGTEWGIIGGIVEALDGVGEGDVIVQEFPDPSATASTRSFPYFDAVVDYTGSFDGVTHPETGDPIASMQELLDALKPFGVGGYYVSPTVYTLDMTVEVAPAESSQTDAAAADIDETRTREAIQNELATLGLGDDLYEQQLEQAALNADSDTAYAPMFSMTLVAPDDTTQSVSGRHAISPREKVEPGDITVDAIENPATGS